MIHIRLLKVYLLSNLFLFSLEGLGASSSNALEGESVMVAAKVPLLKKAGDLRPESYGSPAHAGAGRPAESPVMVVPYASLPEFAPRNSFISLEELRKAEGLTSKAFSYLNSFWLTKDKIRMALLLFTQAGSYGEPRACEFLAEVYEKGLYGLKTDPKLAAQYKENIKWAKRAEDERKWDEAYKRSEYLRNNPGVGIL